MKNPKPQIEPIVIGVNRAANEADVCPRTVWSRISDGTLETIKPEGTRRTLIKYQSFKRWLGAA